VRGALLLFSILWAAVAAAAAPPAIPDGLDPASRNFLEEVAILITPKEREAFLSLQKEYQRNAFIRRFWQVRDPYPETPGNELELRWEDRVQVAREKYPNLAEDRARMLLVFGEAEKVMKSRCSAVLPLELWYYSGTERIKGAFVVAFFQPQGSVNGPYRLWHPSEGVSVLLPPEQRLRGAGSLEEIADECADGQDVVSYLGGAMDWGLAEKRVLPHPGDEWLSAFLQRSTDLPDGAARLPGRLEVAFPSRLGSRTVMQGLVSLAGGDARPETVGGQSFYTFQVDGEILYRDDLFESFRYRFAVPGSQLAAGGEIPLVFQRPLRPGAYTLIVRVENTSAGRYFRDQREIEVPAVTQTAVTAAVAPPAPEAAATAAGAPAPPGSAADALAEANAAASPAPSDEVSLRLLPPSPGLLLKKIRVEAVSTGTDIARVRFELDGKPVLTKGKAPWSVELDLGDQPRLRRLRALGLSKSDELLASDEVLLNAGPHRFSVRLVEPLPGATYRKSLRAQAEVRVPEGEKLAQVDFYLNETRVASLFQPPFVQPILLPAPGETVYVRAVASLADGNSAEDLVLVNSPNPSDHLDVQWVELYTSAVDRRGRPVDGLTKDDFSVFEDGKPQTIRRFDRVRDMPIYAGLMIDTSGSMDEEIKDAVEGALRFFESVLKPKDRAAVITFSDKPDLAVRFTNDRERLAGSLAGLTAGGNTALYDSLIYALYYFGGIQGKKAIILLSDGRDEGSRYNFTDALEYAKRSGVAFYSVGIHLLSKDGDVRNKLQRLSDETGGRAFFIDRSSELAHVYKLIEEEVRSQYLVAYQSANAEAPDKFRSVEVKVARPGIEAKTLRGYYP
jgi:Ca-activated chloride channel homolog